MMTVRSALLFLLLGVAMSWGADWENLTEGSQMRIWWLQTMAVVSAGAGLLPLLALGWAWGRDWMIRSAAELTSVAEATAAEMPDEDQSSEPCSDVSDLSPIAS